MRRDTAEHHPDENGAAPMLSLDDLPALPPEVELRVLAAALDPDAPPAPATLVPDDGPYPDEPTADDATDARDTAVEDDPAGGDPADDLYPGTSLDAPRDDLSEHVFSDPDADDGAW